jgi:hypothetical protein
VAQRFQRCDKVAGEEAASAAEVRMAAPRRGTTGLGTYFITAFTFQKQNLFQSERFSRPFINTLLHYQLQRHYLLQPLHPQ